MKHELINFMFYLVSLAAVFWMSRNPPPKEGALRDIQKTAERETMFYLEHMSICGLSLHQGTTDSRKNLEQRFIFQIGTLNPHGINERFSFN